MSYKIVLSMEAVEDVLRITMAAEIDTIEDFGPAFCSRCFLNPSTGLGVQPVYYRKRN